MENLSPAVEKAAEIVIALAGAGKLDPAETPQLLQDLIGVLDPQNVLPSEPSGPKPAVPIEDSVTHDKLICLEDGAEVVLLKRYLASHHNMTPEEYIHKWGLPEDYPMVAQSYSERRSEIARENKLGKNR